MEKDERLLRRVEVEDRFGISRTKIYRLMREGRFPEPLKVGERSVRWRESEVTSWLESLPRATGETGHSSGRRDPPHDRSHETGQPPENSGPDDAC